MFPFPKGLAVLLSLSCSSSPLPGPEQSPAAGSLQKMAGLHTTFPHLCETLLAADLGGTTQGKSQMSLQSMCEMGVFFKGLSFIKIWHGFLWG